MDRRYLAFLFTAFAIIVVWNTLNPPPVPVEPKSDPNAEAEEAPAEQDEVGRAKKEDEGEAGAPVPPVEIEVPEVDSPPYLTLGSIDPESPYRMAATLSSRGATIRRVQLASPKYRDLHDRSGYLGELELETAASGAIVQSVTPGSPAANAGIEVEDLLVSIIPASRSKMTGGDIAEAADLPRMLAKTKPGEEVSITVKRGGTNKQLTATLIRRPLEVIRPEAENIFLHSDELPEDFEQHPSLELTLSRLEPSDLSDEQLDKLNDRLASEPWAVDESVADQLTYSMVLPEVGLEVVKRFTIARQQADEVESGKPAYHLDFDVEIRNLFSTPRTVQYELQGPNGLPIEGFWYSQKVGRGWSGYGIRDVLLRTYGNSEKDFACRKIAKGDVKAYGDGESLAYIGVDAQYFAAAIIPHKRSADERWFSKFTPNLASTLFDEKNSYRLRYQNASFLLTSGKLELAGEGEATSSRTHSSTLFTGPKRPELLAEYEAPADPNVTLSDFIYYGWFGNLGIPQMMVGILSFFYSFLRNYGLAIILLTVVVRSCMFPLSRKQAKNMMMMQELKPEMDRITARYKDDPQARMKAQQELFAKNNYNPMGGCLLMFIQLPIFIGLYRALMVDVDLRQAALIPGLRWCSNLAAPDMLLDWSGFIWPRWFLNGEGIFALGPYLNILPLLTVALFLLQQKLFMPPAADEQAEMMQKVMKFMMVFMGFMFFKVASGLCLYFIASSLWGIAERKLIPKPNTGGTGIVAPAMPKSPKSPSQEAAQRTKQTKAKQAKAKSNKGGGKRKR